MHAREAIGDDMRASTTEMLHGISL